MSVLRRTGLWIIGARGSVATCVAYGLAGLRHGLLEPVGLATERALKLLRAGKGPVMLEAHSYRYFHQNGPLPGSAFGYRGKDEEAAWRARDPLDVLAVLRVA